MNQTRRENRLRGSDCIAVVGRPGWGLPLVALLLTIAPALHAQGESESPASGAAQVEPEAASEPPVSQPTPEEGPGEASGDVASSSAAPAETESSPSPTTDAKWQVVEPGAAQSPAEPAAGSATPAEPCPEAEPIAWTNSPRENVTEGVYITAGLAAAFSFGTSHEWSSSCPVLDFGTETWAPTCEGTIPVGGALGGSVGYRHGPIGVELYALGAADYSSAQLQGTPPVDLPDYSTTNYVGRVGGGVGIGPRVFVPLGAVSLTGAVGAGFMARAIFSNVSSLEGESEVYVVPSARFDLGVVVLDSLELGVQGWVEFLDSVAVTPDLSSVGVQAAYLQQLGQITVFEGPQFFLGPYVGLMIGGS